VSFAPVASCASSLHSIALSMPWSLTLNARLIGSASATVEPSGANRNEVEIAEQKDAMISLRQMDRSEATCPKGATGREHQMTPPTSARSLLWLLNSMADSSCMARTRC